MQREQISIPKLLSYLAFAFVMYILQSSIFGMWSIRGFHIDLLPCFVAVAAVLNGPMEGVIMGLVIGIFYDAGLSGAEGIYPMFFLLFGLLAGLFSRAALSKNYISVVLITAAEMLAAGILRYVIKLRGHGASLGVVFQQIVGGIIITCVLGYLVYFVMAKIDKRLEPR